MDFYRQNKEALLTILGCAAFILAVAALIVFLLRVDAKDQHQREAHARSLVAQGCGQAAVRKFEIVYGDIDPYDQVTEARKWAKKCLEVQ